MTVRYAEPGAVPWDWRCRLPHDGGREFTSQASSEQEAIYAATCHALDEHGIGNARVDVLDLDGLPRFYYGVCGDRKCSDCYTPAEPVTPDTCDCDGHGCLRCGMESFVRKTLRSQQVRLR